MINQRSKYKKLLHVDLESENAQMKINGDLWEFIGGLPLAYRVYDEFFDYDPIVASTGPLTGFFPYTSKSCVIYRNGVSIIEKFGGGTFGTKLNSSGVDAIIISGYKKAQSYKITLSDGLVDVLRIDDMDVTSDSFDLVISGTRITSCGYFSYGDMSESPINMSGSIYIKIDHLDSVDLDDTFEYEKCYSSLIDSFKNVTVEPRNNPSCMGCPMGCDFSSKGEDDLSCSLLSRALISCGYASDIYKQIPTAFACLSSIGYDYTHEDLERLPKRFSDLKINLFEKIRKSL